jgi:diadenosine tetraphosphate (Ap4A) HIT family hydrolase
MHREHTIQPLCRLCRSNGLLKGDIIAEAADAYLIESLYGSHNYLIIPNIHAESVDDLPDNWWASVKALVPHVPNLSINFNISINIGSEAGQTIKHLHFWVIPRFDGQVASTKGLASLIDVVNAIED